MAVNGRLTFLSHFVICLACTGASFFAWQRGVFQSVYASDASMMTSAIAALFIVTAAYLGRQAWAVDQWSAPPPNPHIAGGVPSADFGHSAKEWSVMLGLLGTSLGLILQGKSFVTMGTASFGALSTSLYTTATGIVSALLIGVMVFSLEAGIGRARR